MNQNFLLLFSKKEVLPFLFRSSTLLVLATQVARADGLLADAFPAGIVPPNLIPDGLKLTGGLVGEAAGNPVGGRSQGGAYRRRSTWAPISTAACSAGRVARSMF
jgi:hypothetical protein